MIRRSVFASLGAIALPASLLLSACPPSPPPAPPATTQPAPTTTPPAPTTTRPTTTTQPAPATTQPAPATTQPAPTTTRPPAPPPTGTQFLATFDTAEDFYNRFQRETFFGGTRTTASVGQWQGDHNMGCEGPTTQRTVHSDGAHDAEMFWWCAPGGDASKGHIMTSMYTDAYAQVVFSPNQVMNNVRRVCWDQSMVNLPRKWTQVIVVPETMYQANGRVLHYVNPELLPFPAHDGISPGPLPVGKDGPEFQNRDAFNANWAPQWNAYLLTFTVGALQQYSREGAHYNFGGRATTDKAPRFRQCFEDLENGTIRHTNMLGDGTSRTVTLPGSIPNGQVRVIFQDDTYDSFKTDLGDRSGGSNPLATWHWDNIAIS